MGEGYPRTFVTAALVSEMHGGVPCGGCEGIVFSAFYIVPPPGREEGSGGPYWLCEPCWDEMVDAAAMTMLR